MPRRSEGSVSMLERGLFLVGGVVKISFALIVEELSVVAGFWGSSAVVFAVFLVLRFFASGAFAAFGAGDDLGVGDDFFLPVRPRLGDASSLLACPA